MPIFTRLLPTPDKLFPPEPCPSCPLGNARKVGARGTPDSPLVIILEAPGTEELKHGAPVCGPSGDLLDKSVPESFDFDQAFVINAMQCRPPKTNDQQKDKAYKSKACAACRERVLRQVFMHPRKAVLAMGGWSNSSLTANYNVKITQIRGEVYGLVNPETGEEVVVVPTVHPAFLLRGSGNPKVFRDDIQLAYDIAFGEGQLKVRKDTWVDPGVQVIETLPDLKEYCAHIGELARHQQEQVELGADIETSGFDWIKDYILCVCFYAKDEQDTAGIIPGRALEDPAFRHYLSEFLASPHCKFVWQFGKFDEKFLRRLKLIPERWTPVQEDSGLQSYTLSEATKDHDLDEIAKNLLGAPEHKHALKPWVKKKSDSYALVPEPVLFDYAAKDVKKQLLVHKVMRPQIAADPHLEKLYTYTLMPASHCLARIEDYGIGVDMDYVRINRHGATQEDIDKGLILRYNKKEKQWLPVNTLNDEKGELYESGLEKEQEYLLNELEQLAGWRVNPNSPPEVKKLLYDQYGLRINNKRPQDTRKETLAKLPLHPAVKLIKKYRSAVKMLSTYVGAIEKRSENGIIHTTYKLHVTPTGRLSSSEPNIQNIPREPRFRRMYRARPGHILLESDYNSAELRMLAALSGDEFLLGVFLDDKRNLHDEVTEAMYGPNWRDNPDFRIRGKAINFGIPYGRDAFSIAMEFDISGSEAQRLIDAWFRRAPGAEKFLNHSARVAANGGSLITMFGRKRRSGVVSAERLDGLQNEFKNFHMQSPISDFTLHSAMEMQDQMEDDFSSHIVNLIHDSTLTEVPDDLDAIIPAAKLAKETMENVPKRWIDTPVLFKVDQKVGTNWGMGQDFETWLARRMEERPTLVQVPQSYEAQPQV